MKLITREIYVYTHIIGKILGENPNCTITQKTNVVNGGQDLS